MIEEQDGQGRKLVTIYDDIYNLADSRAYFQAMHHAGFRTAHHAVAGFKAVLAELRHLRGLHRANIVDFASGYGIAAELLRHNLTLDDVLARYQEGWCDTATVAETIANDRDWLTGNRAPDNINRFIGIDVADKALAYGRDVGVFDAIYAENLEDNLPSEALAQDLSTCDLIVECGSIAHMLPRALDRVLSAAKARRPWIATAPIRGNDTAEAIEVMRDHGYVVESIAVPPFRHRRFADPEEQERAIANAKGRGHDTDGVETTGFFHAQIFLARPPEELTPVADWPISPEAA
ncbi:hypothetical protein ROA7450_01023 [Roseovarius albus]|uniref:Methyltransferase domain protein n=1 Tax=Roseovarius albus TaxID=1247867 RepID=A0A1X6YLQ4_9RHOB|nr:hypothetical protein [Roseovarius albus]SLN24954.1 hypothetical protein ROA7450_01023 [Roseovarius albus]